MGSFWARFFPAGSAPQERNHRFVLALFTSMFILGLQHKRWSGCATERLPSHGSGDDVDIELAPHDRSSKTSQEVLLHPYRGTTCGRQGKTGIHPRVFHSGIEAYYLVPGNPLRGSEGGRKPENCCRLRHRPHQAVRPSRVGQGRA